jgi:hypothetical protein
MVRVPHRLLSLLVAGVCAAACGPTVDLMTGLKVSDVSTGWHDAGIVDGKNKLVPQISFKLTNSSPEPLVALQVNCIFRRVGETEEWGSGWMAVSRADALEPGETTDVLTITSQRGYTGTESRLDLLKNRSFIDARVELFAKYGSTQWARIQEFPIDRQLTGR